MASKGVEETSKSTQLLNGDDWRQWDPDALFQKLTISEVKRTHSKLRLDVEAKQEELRLMVGERYRDLLQASKAIISMNQASLRVLAVLQEVRQTCSQGPAPVVSPEPRSQQLDSTLQEFQILAAHLKLLLDSPEHIWRLLEKKAFLEAAWLYLLCRLVHRALKNNEPSIPMDSEDQVFDVLENFPLIQRQWDLISHLSSQVAHRAKLYLKEGVSSTEVTSSLVSLHLLDHSTLAELLHIYLAQRLKGLRDVLTKPLLSPTIAVEGEAVAALTFSQLGDRLTLLRDTIFQTLDVVGVVFGQRAEANGLALRVLEDINSGARSENMTPSTDDVLASLPSSTHLLLLPPSIRSYRPALDIINARSSITNARESAISTWASDAFQSIKDEVSLLLGYTKTIAELWRLHDQVLSHPDVSESIGARMWKEMVVSATHSHTSILWNQRLSELLETFSASMKEAVKEFKDRDLAADISASSSLFSPMASSDVFSGRGQASSSQNLKRALRQRLDMRQPRLRDILGSVESCAKSLESDLGCIDKHSASTLRELYTKDAFKTLGSAVDVVDGLTRVEDENLDPVLFAGNVALELLERSDLLDTMHCTPDDAQTLRRRLSSIRNRVLNDWQRITTQILSQPLRIALAVSSASPGAQDSRAASQPTYPSGGIVRTCKDLVGEARKLGFQVGSEGLISLVHKAFIVLLSETTASLDAPSGVTWTPELAQIVLDLSFLRSLAKKCQKADSSAVQAVRIALLERRNLITKGHEEARDFVKKVEDQLEGMLLSLRLVLIPMLSIASPVSSKRRHGSFKADTLTDLPVSDIVQLVKPTPRIGLVQL